VIIAFLAMYVYLFNADFSICNATGFQYGPCAIYQNNQYYVFWTDHRFQQIDSSRALLGARVSTAGTVIDPDGKVIFRRQAFCYPAVAYDGVNFLVVFGDSV